MTGHTIAPDPAHGRPGATRIDTAGSPAEDARRRLQLLAGPPEALAADLARRAEDLGRRIARERAA